MRFKLPIPTLNSLLGGKGIPSNSLVLLSGKPGCGKTTMLLDLLIKIGRDRRVLFLSCDDDYTKSIETYALSYGGDSIRAVTGGNLCKSFNVLGTGAPTPGLSQIPSEQWTVDSIIDTAINNIVGNEYASRKFDAIFLDGLNVWFDWLLVHHGLVQKSGVPADALVEIMLRSLKSALMKITNPGIIFATCESIDDMKPRQFESYIADIVLELGQSEVARPDAPTAPTELIHTVQVVKARGCNFQRRSVSFDFRANSNESNDPAIIYYETYPAEGMVRLFSENGPQESYIADFRSIDVPRLYPRLAVEGFDRSNMYHEYAIRRRRTEIPARRPMTITSVDEYWIPKYRHFEMLQPLDSTKLKCYGLPVEAKSVDERRAVPHFANYSMLVIRKDVLQEVGIAEANAVPTWDAVEDYCLKVQRDLNIPHPLLLEMKHVDTFVCLLLELIGGHWPDGATDWMGFRLGDGRVGWINSGAAQSAGENALQRLRRWVQDLKIVRCYGTDDPSHSSNRRCSNRPSWAIGRLWYSTLIDWLFPRGETTVDRDRPRCRDILVTRIPGERPKGSVTTCGDWFLAVEQGAENMELAYSILNTLLSPSKLIQLAISGGGLPVAPRFFDEFGKTIATGTNRTYNIIREMFYGEHRKICRSNIPEYRHVMQRLYAAGLQAVQSNEPVKDIWQQFVANLGQPVAE